MSTQPVSPPKRIDFATTHDTKYAIPLWLRDEQIKLACQRPIRRLEAYEGPTRTEPIAVVCFGPSLRDTWEEIKNFQYIITCSGSHKFLIDRGIIPTWHVEVDPRPHKIELLGPPHPDVTYLPASTCHPKYFDHLGDGPNVVLWHIFSNEPDAYRVLPRGEWTVLGGANVGLRAIALARFFGFRKMVVFGMDGCQRDTKHAGPHPLQDGTGFSIVEYEGVEYKTTPAMLETAKGTVHEIDRMPDVEFEFRGEGLVQEMMKRHQRPDSDGKKFYIAIQRPELISAEYRELNKQLHHDNLAYGVGAGKHAPTVLNILAKTTELKSVLDYGCGKGYLAKSLPFPIWEYDPAVPGKDEAAHPADLVCCFDVLEHVEPDKLGPVLDDLRRCVLGIGYFVIHCGPAAKTLADGRNTHLIQRPHGWWVSKLKKFFTVGAVTRKGPEVHIVVAPKLNEKKMKAKVA